LDERADSDETPDSTTLASRRLGTVLSEKWRLERLLGVGGMGAVYAAVHLNNLKKVAIKVLHPEFAANADIKRRFQREGYLANKVGHPGVVSVLDDGVAEDGAPYFVMELLEGESLRARAIDREEGPGRSGRIPPRELLLIVDKVLDILATAHEAGVVHRDLKPDNIFLTHNGEVKVVDFGVARTLDLADEKTRAGLVMGTPEYMPPEQARGRSELIDGRSDLWAVGALLYRLVTGRPTRDAETSNEVLLLAMTEPIPKVASVMPDVDPKLADLIDVALEFDKEKRFADARSMQAALAVALASVTARDERSTAAVEIPVDARDLRAVAHALTVPAGQLTPPGHARAPLWITKDAPKDDVAVPLRMRQRRGFWAAVALVSAGAAVGAFSLNAMEAGGAYKGAVRAPSSNVVSFPMVDAAALSADAGALAAADDAGPEDMGELGEDAGPKTAAATPPKAGGRPSSSLHGKKKPLPKPPYRPKGKK
jgi:eukaryotic-like serine/threonine-protein kinase